MKKTRKKKNILAILGIIIGYGCLFMFSIFVVWKSITPSTTDDTSVHSQNTSRETETTETTKATTTEEILTGWQTINGNTYYYDETGHPLTSQWIDDSYLDSDGKLLKNTITPDHHYVNSEGKKDDTVSLANSKAGLYDLKRQLEDTISDYSGTWSVYVKNIDTNEYMVINEEPQYTASLIKLFCAATIYELRDTHQLEWDDSIENLMTAMISVSDNDAFNLLVRKCDLKENNHVNGRAVIQDYLDRNDYVDTTITSALYPTSYPAPSSAGRNMTTTIDCGLFLEKLYKEQISTPASSQELLDLMLDQQRTGKIPAGLPKGTKCANKTGETNNTQHDAAIVYSPNATYILVIMSTDCGSAISNIQNLSQLTYFYFNPEESE